MFHHGRTRHSSVFTYLLILILYFIRKLVTKEIPIDEFLSDVGRMSSENGILTFNLVLGLKQQYDRIPREYSSLLDDLCKFSSISGYLQPTGPLALHLLKV